MAKEKGASLMQAMPKPSEKDMQYETEDHVRTLERASDIMADPEKVKRVHKLAGRRHKAIQAMVAPKMKTKKKIRSVQDLKDRRDELARGDDMDGDDE